MDQFFLVHFIATVFMTGLIWLIQLVHYPSFKYVDKSKFIEFEKFHSRRISFIVMPIMILELLTGLALFIYGYLVIMAINLALLIVIWLTTFFFSMKYHSILSGGYDEAAVDKLIQTNWIRTISWSIRLLLLSSFLI